MADCYIKRSVQSLTVANSPPPPFGNETDEYESTEIFF